MKQFCYGDVVCGYKTVVRADRERVVVSLASDHAKQVHGIQPAPRFPVEDVHAEARAS